MGMLVHHRYIRVRKIVIITIIIIIIIIIILCRVLSLRKQW